MSQESCKVVLDTLRSVRVISHTNSLIILTSAFLKGRGLFFIVAARLYPPADRTLWFTGSVHSDDSQFFATPELTRTCRKVFAPPILTDWRGTSPFNLGGWNYFPARTSLFCDTAATVETEGRISSAFPLISAKSFSYWSTTRSQS